MEGRYARTGKRDIRAGNIREDLYELRYTRICIMYRIQLTLRPEVPIPLPGS